MNTHQYVNRRSFLLMAGAAATAATLPTIIGRSHIHTIALLLPQSAVYEPFGRQFQAGSNQFLAEHLNTNARLNITTHDIPFTHTLARQKIETLLKHNRPDIVIGVMETQFATRLADLFAATPFLLANVGANMTDTADLPFAYQSLHQWQSHVALGQWAAVQHGTRTVIAASHYESGYDSLYAFEQGFEREHGTVADTIITHLPEQSVDFELLFATIDRAKPDFVTAFYCGDAADHFLHAWQHSRHAALPLVGSCLPTSNVRQLDTMRSVNLTMMRVVPSVATTTRTFNNLIEQLGYESLQRVANAIEEAETGDTPLPQALRVAMQTVRWQLYTLQQRFGRTYTPPHAPDTVTPPAIRTGWLNPYLAA